MEKKIIKCDKCKKSMTNKEKNNNKGIHVKFYISYGEETRLDIQDVCEKCYTKSMESLELYRKATIRFLEQL